MSPTDKYVQALKDVVEEFDTDSEEFVEAVEEVLLEFQDEIAEGAYEEGYSEGFGDAREDLEVW